MTHTKSQPNNFADALKYARKASELSQEAFGLVSSRTYVSTLERDKKSPTLTKVDQLSEVMNIHPLTLLTLAYMRDQEGGSPENLFARVLSDISQLRRQL
jgi:transcriptional regulator with XRE-family HTH domain